MAENRTELSDLGEFGLIDRIQKGVKTTGEKTVKGIGDDAAVIDSGDHYTLVSTDMLMEGIHFDLSYVPLAHLGYKAVAVNVSDIAAMNGTPTQITVSIGLSNRFSLEAIDALYSGINAACESYNIDLVGGDTTSSASGLVISITAIGTVAKDRITYRSGAKLSDIICVTGDLGAAYMGLQVLEREKQVFLTNPEMQPQLEKYDYIVQRQLKAEARMDIIHELKELDILPTSMIDISDGLGSELLHLSKASDLGVQIYEDKLPIDKQTYDTGFELTLDSTTAAINGGEDYELLFTISQSDFEKVKTHQDIHLVGFMHEKEKGCKMATKGNSLVDITAQGWNHLKP
jgi:thiamine-monophosphate kinase